jgi:PBSX family phage terminase large subunit
MAPHFMGVHRDCKQHKHTHYWLKGGRGSTKSSFVSLELLLLLLQHPDCHIVVMRKVGNTLRNSVFPQLEWAIEVLQLTGKFKVITSPPEITYKRTGQKILFLGVDDKSKIKSLKLPFGYVGLVWFEELDQFAGMNEIRNITQSLLRGGPEYWCFYSFNPPKSRDSWVNIEQLSDDADRLVDHSTYLQVPKEWLGEQFLLEANKLKEKNETYYMHEYMGEVTGTGGSVFENVADMVMSDDMIAQFDHLHHGLDFGFSLDPLAYVGMNYDSKHEDLYIFDEIYSIKLFNKTVYDLIKGRVGRRMVGADGAEAKSIAEMRRYGLNIYGPKKGPDSVEYGIKWLQERFHIYIDKRRCPNTYREFVSYEYEMNKDGQYISAYPDKNNHAIDAVRYGISEAMNHDKVVVRRINY